MAMCMSTYLGGVLKGSSDTKKSDIQRAINIQQAIAKRWQRDHPKQWQLKHVHWLLDVHLRSLSQETRYRYWLTLRVILKRIKKVKDWEPRLQGSWTSRTCSSKPKSARAAVA